MMAIEGEMCAKPELTPEYIKQQNEKRLEELMEAMVKRITEWDKPFHILTESGKEIREQEMYYYSGENKFVITESVYKECDLAFIWYWLTSLNFRRTVPMMKRGKKSYYIPPGLQFSLEFGGYWREHWLARRFSQHRQNWSQKKHEAEALNKLYSEHQQLAQFRWS